ncbi:immunoglobulin-like domain-containing protein [Paenibacillus shenyangensis]|uniref:immunoglobulin-like domain-containing protein n=1 Tax=Paenibacillus sp. A9 TaxID=1284352 RepID=UPI00036DF26D|nr:immunoglobulin-like domain-containing protein [Paenibacillus sp. A9]
MNKHKRYTWLVWLCAILLLISNSGYSLAAPEATLSSPSADNSDMAPAVSPSVFHVGLAKYEDIDGGTQLPVDPATQANNEAISIAARDRSLIQKNSYEYVLTSSQALRRSVTSVTYSVYTTISLTDSAGRPLDSSSGVKLTVNGQPYPISYVTDSVTGSGTSQFVFKLALSSASRIAPFELLFARPGYADVNVFMVYRPAGTVTVEKIGAIKGPAEVGALLSAGEIGYGRPLSGQAPAVRYQWYRSNSAAGAYIAIKGATASQYRPVEEDAGKFIRVHIQTNEQTASGSALSPPTEKIARSGKAEQIFTAIESRYFPADKRTLRGSLKLPASLPEYPGVTISWKSDNEAVMTSAGVVSRAARDDQEVILTAILSDQVVATKSYALLVQAEGSTSVGIVGQADPYFQKGYPEMYVKNGQIHARYALSQPGEVYMVVSKGTPVIMYDEDRAVLTVQAVMEGHGGNTYRASANAVAWPYQNITAAQVGKVQDINTGIDIDSTGFHYARVGFVIVDKSKQYVSPAVTMVQYNQIYRDRAVYQSAELENIYINRALDTIYVYYDRSLYVYPEEWAADQLPLSSDYQLSRGQITKVSVAPPTRIESRWGIYRDRYAIILQVKDITPADLSGLQLSYHGDRLTTDKYYHPVDMFQDEPVRFVGNYDVADAVLSSDRTKLSINILPGWGFHSNTEMDIDEFKNRLNVRINGTDYHPVYVPTEYFNSVDTTNRLQTGFHFVMDFAQPLPVSGEKPVFWFNTDNIHDWVGDLYPPDRLRTTITEMPKPGAPSAIYTAANAQLRLTFAKNYAFSDQPGMLAGVTVRVDGTDYPLRGFVPPSGSDLSQRHILRINLNDPYYANLRQALAGGSNVQIKYAKTNGGAPEQLKDQLGSLLPDFGYVSVSRQ